MYSLSCPGTSVIFLPPRNSVHRVQNQGCCFLPSLFIYVWSGLFSLTGTVPTLPHKPNGDTP